MTPTKLAQLRAQMERHGTFGDVAVSLITARDLQILIENTERLQKLEQAAEHGIGGPVAELIKANERIGTYADLLSRALVYLDVYAKECKHASGDPCQHDYANNVAKRVREWLAREGKI